MPDDDELPGWKETWDEQDVEALGKLDAAKPPPIPPPNVRATLPNHIESPRGEWRRQGPWWRRPPRAIKRYVYAFFAGVGALLIGVLLWRSKERGPSTFSASVAVQKERQKIEGLKVDRQVLIEQVDDRDAEVKAIDLRIVEAKKQIVAIQAGKEDLSDAEAEAAFDKLGY